MARHATHGGVLVLTSDKIPDPTPIAQNPKVSLYTYLPRGSRCVFSQHAGQPALEHILVRHDIPRDWCPQQIQETAAAIRRRHPDAVESLTVPSYWEDLHQYFHPKDLWHSGASNLYKVVLRLLKENEICMWVESWLTWEQNRYKLSLWDPSEDIRSIFDHHDWYNINFYHHTLPEDYILFFCDVLKYWYGYYRNLGIGAVNPAGTAALVAPATMATSPSETPQLEGQGKFICHCCSPVFFLRWLNKK